MKNSSAKNVVVNLFLPQVNKNFMRKEDLPTNQNAAPNAGKHANNKRKENFTMQSAQNAESKQKFLSNQ